MDMSERAAKVAAPQTGALYERNAAVMFFDRVRRSPNRVAVSLLDMAAGDASGVEATEAPAGVTEAIEVGEALSEATEPVAFVEAVAAVVVAEPAGR